MKIGFLVLDVQYYETKMEVPVLFVEQQVMANDFFLRSAQ
jgi:hypothetical protein